METLAALFADIIFWHWWAFALLLLGFEIVVPSTFLLWPAASAGATGVVLLIAPGLDLRFQVLIFAILSGISTVAWFRWHKRQPIESERSNLNTRGQSYVGRVLTLKKAMKDGRGRIRIEDTTWSARSESGASIDKGTRIEVVACDGTIMVIKEIE